MGPPAKLHRHSRDLHNPDPVTILFIEEGHGSGSQGIGLVLLGNLHRSAFADPAIDHPLNLRKLSGRHRGPMREVKTKPVRQNEGACLPDMVSQDLPEG